MGLLENPMIQSAVVPLLSALLLVPVLRGAAGTRAASGAVALALCAGIASIQGFMWPPHTAMQKLPWLVLAALLVGWLLDAAGARSLRRAAIGGVVLAGTGWLGWPLLRSLELANLLLVATVSLVGVAVLLHLDRDQDGQIDAPVMLLAASLALSGTALYGSSASVAQVAGALAAALGGFLLWNWPAPRHAFAGGGVCGSGGALVFLLAILAFYTQASKLALLLACGALGASALVAALLSQRTSGMEFLALRSTVGRPVFVFVVALVPVALALAAAYGAAEASTEFTF
jgi:hypothetical protein